jgi:mono/diheme cytochrome c family protein
MLRSFTAGLLIAGTAGTALAGSTTGSSNVTFNKDVLPILQKNCQTCHRPGEIGPMAFLNYEGTRPWAKSIKKAVLTKQMPPWFADPRYGHFANERKLSDTDIKTIASWVDSGAPEGNAKDMPRPSFGPKAGTSNLISRSNFPSPTRSRRTAPSSTPISSCPAASPRTPG